MSEKAVRIWKLIGLSILLFSVAFTAYGYNYELATLPLAHELAIPAFWGASGVTYEVIYCTIWLLCLLVSIIGVPITLISMLYKLIKG